MRSDSRLLLRWAIALTLIQPVLVWFVWFRVAGYTPWSVTVAQLSTALLGLGLIMAARLDWRALGFGLRNLVLAVIIGFGAYAVTILLGVLLGYAADGELFRRYTLTGFVSGWFLTGVVEELLFAGALFNIMLLTKGKARGAGWKTVVLTAFLFALWHLPGYIATALAVETLSMGSILGRLGLNFASWLMFGTIYTAGGNFWLVALAHASTDYPLTGLITEVPVLGLVFMTLLIAGGWYVRRRYGSSAG